MVSHDRVFDNVVTSVLVFEESGWWSTWAATRIERRGRTLRVAESAASEAPAEAIAPAVRAPLPAVAEAPAKRAG